MSRGDDSASSLLLAAEDSKKVTTLFVEQFYTTLVENFQNFSTLYAANSELCFEKSTIAFDAISQKYKDLGLDVAFFDFSKGSVASESIFGHGILVTVSGIVKIEKDSKIVEKELDQKFILMPSNSCFLILRDELTLGKDKIVQSKASAAAPNPIPAPKKQHQVQQQIVKKDAIKKKKEEPKSGDGKFSYAKAAASASASTDSATVEAVAQKPVVAVAQKKPVQKPLANGTAPATATFNGKSAGSANFAKKKLLVKNLPQQADEDMVRASCSVLGEITYVKKLNPTMAMVEFAEERIVTEVLGREARERSVQLLENGNQHTVFLWRFENRAPKFNNNNKNKN